MIRVNLGARGLLLALTAGLLTSCNQGGGGAVESQDDTATSGSIRIAVDATFEPILQSQVDTFQKLYPYAKVQAAYKPELEVMQDLLTSKVRVAVVARTLNANEQNEFKRQTIVPRVTHIGTDGLAIIVHPANADSMLTLAQLRDVFTGKTSQWAQISGKKALGAINVVFDANRSSTARYVQDSITRGAPLTPRVYAAKSNPALLDYVATHPSAIGVIGVNWISDRDDRSVQTFRHKVRVVGVSTAPTPTSANDYVQPYQAYLAQKTYPLRRDLYIISREARTGLGTGFASFVAGNKGQLIMLKSGLMPATGQVRLVSTATE